MGIGILFLGAGLIHFTHAELFEKLVPVTLKDYRGIINAVTGVLIFAMGVAFLVPRLRAVARWSAIALLVVTLPVICTGPGSVWLSRQRCCWFYSRRISSAAI